MGSQRFISAIQKASSSAAVEPRGSTPASTKRRFVAG